MLVPIFRATVKKGLIVPDDPAGFSVYKAKLEGCECELILRKKQKKRTLPQNSYFHGVVIRILCDHTGYTPEEMLEAIKWMFLRVHRDGLPDTCRGTSDLSTVEFSTLVEDIIQWASVDLGVYVPLPNEVSFNDMVPNT